MVLEQTTEGCNFIKKETLAQVFPRKFCEISKNNFFTEHLWAIASEHKNWTTTFQKVHLLVLTFVLQEQLPEVFYEKMFHSANVSSATNAIRWRFFFFFFNLNLRQTKCSVYLTNLFFLLIRISHWMCSTK